MAWAHTSNIQIIRVGGSCEAASPSSSHHPRLDNLSMLIHNACSQTCLTYSSAWNLLLLALASYNSYKTPARLLELERLWGGRYLPPYKLFGCCELGKFKNLTLPATYTILCVCYAHDIMCVTHMVFVIGYLHFVRSKSTLIPTTFLPFIDAIF